MAEKSAEQPKKRTQNGKLVEEKPSFSRLKSITKDTLHNEAIKIAWKSIRSIVALRLMGDRGCAVPHLQDATQYGLLNVLVKEKRPLVDRITRKPPTLHWSVPLESLLPAQIKLEDFRNAHTPELVEKDSRDLLQYHLRNTDNAPSSQKEKKLCEVEVKIRNLQHYKIKENHQETPVALNRHFEDVSTIERLYLITEVYVASSMIMNVKIKTIDANNESEEFKYQWNSDSMMPIGIVFKKCDLTSGGILQYGLEVERKKAIEYNWIETDEVQNKPKQWC